MGIKPPISQKRKLHSIGQPVFTPLTEKEKSEAVETLKSISADGYGDGKDLFNGEEIKVLMKATTRNLLSK